MRYTGRKLSRQSGTTRALPKNEWQVWLTLAARLRPARTPALAVRPAASHQCPDSLTGQDWSETSPSRFSPAAGSRPCTLATVRLDLRSAVEDSAQTSARAGATRVPRPADPAYRSSAVRLGWHERPARLTVLVPARLWPHLAFPDHRQHTLCVRSARASLHYFIPNRTDTPHS